MTLDGNTEITKEILKGSSQATVDKLKAAGLVTLLQVAVTPPLEIIEKTEIKQLDTAKKAWMSAQKAMRIYRSAEELYQERLQSTRRLRINAKRLDSLIGGGIEPGVITELIGGFGSGKTQICFNESVIVQLPAEEGGFNSKTLFFDTESTFAPERIYEMAEARGLDPHETLRNIHVVRAYNSDHLRILIQNVSEMLQEDNYGLIVVDSMIGHFRSEYIGRGTLAPRQQMLAGILGNLLRIAKSFDVAVIVTNQIIANVTGWGPNAMPAGGNIMAHAGTLRLELRKGRAGARIAKVIDSSYLPEGEAPFWITARGVEDLEED